MEQKLKHLDLTKSDFTANGKRYTITDSLSFERFREFEKLEVHVGYGVSFEEIFKTLKKLYGHLNKTEFVDSAIVVHNLLNGISQKLEGRTHPALLLCALFINVDGEDVTKYDSVAAEQKVKNWATEYYVNDFFQLAVNLVSGFIPAFKELSQSTSKPGKTNQNTMKNTV